MDSQTSAASSISAARRRATWVWLRRGVQLLALAFVIWSIIRMNVLTLGIGLSPHLFLQLDPLVALTGAIAALRHGAWMGAGWALLFAIPVLLLTALFGRAFCGWLCPMGTCIDAADRLVWRKQPSRVKFTWHWLKYVLLAAFVVTALFGSQLLYVLDPISIFTRSIVVAAFPLIGKLFGLSDHLLPREEITTLFGYAYQGNLLIGLFFLAIFGLGALGRRMWCRTLCPLGALLGLVSRIAPFGRRVSPECRSCGSCVRRCRMAATPDGASQQSSECIQCGECAAVCPTGLVSLRTHGTVAASEEPVNLSRRRFAFGTVAGVAWVGAMTTGVGSRLASRSSQTNESLLRPPAALPEADFLARCTRCGACMKACPTGGLQPALTEAGVEGVLSPVLVPRLGACAPGCNACAQVCANQAIQPFNVEEKSHIYIGTARIDHSACLMWQDGVQAKKCLVCDEHCPYDAIYVMTAENGKRVPYVNEARCVGCGACENACPVGPVAAIRVRNAAPYGDKRGQTTQEQREWQQSRDARYPQGE